MASLFQQSTDDIENGVSQVSVVFPVEFPELPSVFAIVENLSADDPKLLLGVPLITAKTTEGFTIQLGGETDTANYKLTWCAGVGEAFSQYLINAAPAGLRLSDVPTVDGDLADGDYVVAVQDGRLVKFLGSQLRQMFGRRRPVPAGPEAPGEDGDRATGTNHEYSHDGVDWKRHERETW